MAGHAVLFAYNQANGDSAVESFGPIFHNPIEWGKSMYEMDSFTSADDLRSKFTSLTIQASPELTQEVITYIRTNPDPKVWFMGGLSYSSQCAKILLKFQLIKPNPHGNDGLTPGILWDALITQRNPNRRFEKPQNGKDYGNNRFGMFNLMWQSLPQEKLKDNVTVTVEGATDCTLTPRPNGC